MDSLPDVSSCGRTVSHSHVGIVPSPCTADLQPVFFLLRRRRRSLFSEHHTHRQLDNAGSFIYLMLLLPGIIIYALSRKGRISFAGMENFSFTILDLLQVRVRNLTLLICPLSIQSTWDSHNSKQFICKETNYTVLTLNKSNVALYIFFDYRTEFRVGSRPSIIETHLI